MAGTMFLEYIVVGDCCIPYQPEPSVRMGKPHDPDQYRQEHVDGVTVLFLARFPRCPWSSS